MGLRMTVAQRPGLEREKNDPAPAGVPHWPPMRGIDPLTDTPHRCCWGLPGARNVPGSRPAAALISHATTAAKQGFPSHAATAARPMVNTLTLVQSPRGRGAAGPSRGACRGITMALLPASAPSHAMNATVTATPTLTVRVHCRRTPRAHRVRAAATISGQTPVNHPKMHAPKQPIQPQKTLVASTPLVFPGFFSFVPINPKCFCAVFALSWRPLDGCNYHREGPRIYPRFALRLHRACTVTRAPSATVRGCRTGGSGDISCEDYCYGPSAGHQG